MTLLWIWIGLAALFSIPVIIERHRRSKARDAGILPLAGHGTMADVERLAASGQKIDAIRCYREIHRCSLVEAKQAVDRCVGRTKKLNT